MMCAIASWCRFGLGLRFSRRFRFRYSRFRLVVGNGALCCHANGAKHEEQGENEVFGVHDVCGFDLL